tara:strand:+ start:521 stop:1384 length:864 start_codon:yes stop_codon:yes gene_type:complete
MKFFADTASLPEIEDCFSRNVGDGITTNPKILETTGDLTLGFEGACKQILKKYPEVPVSLETDLQGIPIPELGERVEEVKNKLLKQAYELASWGKNVVIKIPICEGGVEATKVLSSNGIKTNVTACMTPYQALEAAGAGATYVSLFANRMLDSHILELSGNPLETILENPEWKKVVGNNKERYTEEAWKRTLMQIAYVAQILDNEKSCLIIGSIRSPRDIHRLVKAQPQVITIPTKIVKELENISELKTTKRSIKINLTKINVGYSLLHSMTHHTLDEFERSADSYR